MQKDSFTFSSLGLHSFLTYSGYTLLTKTREVLRMKKWLALGLVVVALALVAVPVLAKANEAQLTKLEKLYQQLTSLKKKIVDTKVEAGLITAEQGTAIKERADEHYDWLKENGFQCPGYGLGGGGRRGGQGRTPGAGTRLGGMGCPFTAAPSLTQE